MKDTPHRPVLYQEIIHALQPRNSGCYLDGTVGAGGHARGVLEACAPDGRLLGLDVDPHALALARETLAPYGERVILVQASYAGLLETMHDVGWATVDGIVLDLGVSSMQLEVAERGFSFRHDGPLDMRFNPDRGMTAAQLLNTAGEAELAELLFRYGEEPRGHRIARMIVAARPITGTLHLAAIVKRAYPGPSRIHPATRTFQALRMAVNDELNTLEQALPRAVKALKVGGRLAVISFHSLEDRTVKNFLREQSRDLINPPFEQRYERERRATLRQVNRRSITPGLQETRDNPRARSARLRVAEKVRDES